MLRQVNGVETAIEALRRGEFALVYDRDGREGETDFVLAAKFVRPEHIFEMRREAGGLICAAIPSAIATRLGLPFMADVLDDAAGNYPVLSGLKANDIPYGDKPSFSLTLNHRSTFTGISDNDRSLTVRELSSLVGKAQAGARTEELVVELAKNFRSPGHVHVLIGNGLSERTGHTELSLALAEMAGVIPATVVCEMLDGATGRSLAKRQAMGYAERTGRAFVEGSEIVEAHRKFKRA